MHDPTRRDMYSPRHHGQQALATTPTLFAQQTGQGEQVALLRTVRIHFEEAGSGFPLLLIAGGGLNSAISALSQGNPFDAIAEFKGEYRCIAADLRNANTGQSSGPIEADRPWEAFTDDHIGLMDHLGIGKFMVMGFCIGGPLIWNLLGAHPIALSRESAQPVGDRMSRSFLRHQYEGMGSGICQAPARRGRWRWSTNF